MTKEQIAELKKPENIRGRLAAFDRLLVEREELQWALAKVLPLVPQGRAWQRVIYDDALAAYAFSRDK